MTTHNLYTVNNTTPTLVSPSGLDSGVDITIQNVNDTGYIYIGGEGVSSSSYGFRLFPNQAFSVELAGTDDLYVIGSSTSLSVAVLTTSLERTF